MVLEVVCNTAFLKTMDDALMMVYLIILYTYFLACFLYLWNGWMEPCDARLVVCFHAVLIAGTRSTAGDLCVYYYTVPYGP
jgi:CHASE2 domain-containing sensor protein